MSDFTMLCVECLLHHPYKHDEPWTCPACGLIHAVVMPGVPLAEPGAVEKPPRYMTPEREEAIEAALAMADWWGPWSASHVEMPSCGDSLALARKARDASYSAGAGLNVIDGYLEGAALLRDGWSPGGKVVRK
jgi:hypothetical protein